MSLKVSELFLSIQGESSFAGLPTVFIRLTGCNLRCLYCDTTYAYEGGIDRSVEQIVQEVMSFGYTLVEITGGEPLMQTETPLLASRLQQEGCTVLVETNGSLDISVLPPEVIRIMDMKCPSSGENHSIRWENLWKLTPKDEVKFVISDRHDYEWARGILRERFSVIRAQILFSTVFGELPPRKLAQWMLNDRIQARFQLQIHKVIWPQDSRSGRSSEYTGRSEADSE
ncbi:MAG: radical SAM protein [Pseudomonadota bacterium]